MDKIHEGLEGGKIEAGSEMVQAFVCAQTGDLATASCEGIMEYFTRGQEPEVYCDGNHGSTDVFGEEVIDGTGFNEDGTPIGAPETDEIPFTPEANGSGDTTIGDLQAGDFLPSQASR